MARARRGARSDTNVFFRVKTERYRIWIQQLLLALALRLGSLERSRLLSGRYHLTLMLRYLKINKPLQPIHII